MEGACSTGGGKAGSDTRLTAGAMALPSGTDLGAWSSVQEGSPGFRARHWDGGQLPCVQPCGQRPLTGPWPGQPGGQNSGASCPLGPRPPSTCCLCRLRKWGQGPMGTQTVARCHSWWVAVLASDPSHDSVRCFLSCRGQHPSPCQPLTLVLLPHGHRLSSPPGQWAAGLLGAGLDSLPRPRESPSTPKPGCPQGSWA